MTAGEKVRLPRQLSIFCEKFGDRPSVTILGYDERLVEVDAGEKSAFWCPELICIIFRDVFSMRNFSSLRADRVLERKKLLMAKSNFNAFSLHRSVEMSSIK